MEKLYMIEVLVTKIVFAETPVPLKRDIIIQAACGALTSLEIRTDVMGALENLESKERSSKRKDVDIGCGRSVVFPVEPKKLNETLVKSPLEVSVFTKTNEDTPMATVLVQWNSDFMDMVNSSEQSSGYLTPVYIESSFSMLNPAGEFGGNIDLFIRLSYLGRYIFTNFQKTKKDGAGVPGAPEASYLFKSIDNATIFQCTRYGMGDDTDVMPVAPVYNMTNRTGMMLPGAKMTKSTETLLTMQMSMRGSTSSMTPSVFFNMGPRDKVAMRNVINDSIMSLMSVGPLKGKKMCDLTELHMDCSTFSTIANAIGLHTLVYDEAGAEGEDGEGGMGFMPLLVDYKALTVKEIEEKLCKHPDCPAARMFKEFGIGPLAKNINGLGGLYKDINAPCLYGLSHANGTIEGYGPLGRFKRPKKVEEPFVPQSDCKCGRKTSKSSIKSTGSNTDKKSECYKHCPMVNKRAKSPLRLRGGSPLGPECDDPPLPNPLTLCQDLMDDFNKVLKEYKDALGPCGQATCPFAMNIIGGACQEICNSADPERLKQLCNLANPEAKLEERDEFTGCGTPACPYKRAAIQPAEREYSKYSSQPGCGYTNCPFVRAKLGMEDEEDRHLPAFKDYQKQETYNYADKLPPIHWDCPDPLPQGDCKNPDCPYVKRDALIKKYFPDPCCPCGNPACPYVSAPCTFPGCPFSIAEPCPPVCPYTEPPPKELKCTASVCPFVRNTETKCENPECPYRQFEERLEECRRQMELEALEAEEEEAPCRPCGRARSKRARSLSDRSRARSNTSQASDQDKTATDASSSGAPEKPSEPCVLAAAAYDKQEDGSGCSPDSCGKGDLICGICTDAKVKGFKQSKDQSSVSFNASTTNDKDKNKTGDGSKSSKVTGTNVKQQATKRPINEEPSMAKDPKKRPKPGKASAVPAPTKNVPSGAVKPKLCRKSPFRFDKKSYRPCKHIGHRECCLPKFLVPKDMGWLWNIHTDGSGLRPRRGWKPGAISKQIALRIDYFNGMHDVNARKSKSKDLFGEKPSKPTVTIQKKDGVVNVTMLPVKDPAEVKRRGDGNPYMDCTPIQFKITKNDPEKEKKYCFCGDEISTASSSELNIEFSPPAALKNPRLMCRNELFEQEVQYDINDVPLPPPPPPKEKKKDLLSFLGAPLRRLVPLDNAADLLLRVHQIANQFKIHESFNLLQAGSVTIGEPLRLRGGGPVKPELTPMPNAATLCKDLMADYDRLMADYHKALGPCGTATCPLNFNVLEDKCRKVCHPPPEPHPCPEPYCPPAVGPCGKPICPHLPTYSVTDDDYEAEEDYITCKGVCGPQTTNIDGVEVQPCGRSTCPFGKRRPPCPDPKCLYLDECTLEECKPALQSNIKTDPTKDAIKCNKHICPYKKDELTVNDVNPANRKIKGKKGCGSPFCPHVARKLDEVQMPKFPCKKPCPSADELPPIHWDCPDPLPIGECINPNCPLREKPPCGHCPMSIKHCGYPGCPYAGDDLCPPTCPYALKKAPKHIDCTPSVCPLVRPCGYQSLPAIQRRRDKPCGDRCPYTKGFNTTKKSCGDPHCPYRTCADDEDSNASEACCSNPDCPYKMAARRRAAKQKKEDHPHGNAPCALHVREKPEGGATVSTGVATVTPTDTFTETTVTHTRTVSHKEDHQEASRDAAPRLSDTDRSEKSKSQNKNKSILKLMKGSMMAIQKARDIEESDQEPNVCREISCASYEGDRLCKKCQKRKLEEETEAGAKEPKNKREAKKLRNKPKKKKHWGYVYDKGTYYPGIKFGHKECKHFAARVPWDMGWLWNTQQACVTLKPRKGWRPGAIGRTILKFINEQRKKMGLPPRPMVKHPFPQRHAVEISPSTTSTVARLKRSRMRISQEHIPVPKPTLSIKKKDGIVYVTMNPLKDPTTMADNEYPYIDCSPLEFKIIKKKQEDEFKKCMCNGGEEDDGSSVKSSELDIEFTPPAGIVRPAMARNKHVCHTESQYNKADIPKSPEELEAERLKSKKGKKGKSKKGKGGKAKGGGGKKKK